VKLSDYLTEKTVEAQSSISGSSRILERLVDLVEAPKAFMDSATLLAEIKQREKLGSTGIGEGVAIPHVHLKDVHEMRVAMLTTKSPVEFGAVDEKPCGIFIMVVAPDDDRDAYLNLLSAVSGLMRREHVRKALSSAASSGDILKVLREAERA